MSKEYESTEHLSLPLQGKSNENLVSQAASEENEIHQVFYQGQNWYRIVDVVTFLDVTKDASDYWGKMKSRIKTEGFDQTRREIMQFELKSLKDKRLRKHEYATRQTLLRLLQSIPSPKVESFRVWLAEVGEQRLQQEEVDRVEAELEDVRVQYRKKGMEERWIEDRILNLVGRNELTDQWRKRGAIEHLHFAKLTNILHRGALGVTTNEHTQIKSLPKREHLRDHMDRVELALLSLAEATATTKHIENDTQGVKGLEQDARDTAKGSEAVRMITEQSLGRPVVTSQNFLNTSVQGRGKKRSLPLLEQATLFVELAPGQKQGKNAQSTDGQERLF